MKGEKGMISIKELKKQIGGSDELKAEADAIKTEEELAEFLKKNDCDATPDEFRKYYGNESVELDDAELDNVAGGSVPDKFHKDSNGCYDYATCSNCGGKMDLKYVKTGFFKENYHYVCNGCGRDIWFDTIFGRTGVTYKGR